MEPLVVAAGIVLKEKNVLISRRRKDVHLADYWEFPGGKQEGGESLAECLQREFREELGIEIRVREPILDLRYSYPDRVVHLHYYLCEWTGGSPIAGGCQEFRWIPVERIESYSFPPANAAVIQWLKDFSSRRPAKGLVS
jgi:mutator protein MutT